MSWLLGTKLISGYTMPPSDHLKSNCAHDFIPEPTPAFFGNANSEGGNVFLWGFLLWLFRT
jgi:hypothetical protein